MANNPIRDETRKVVVLQLSAAQIQQGLMDAPVALSTSNQASEKASSAQSRSETALANAQTAMQTANAAKADAQTALTKSTSVEQRANNGEFNGATPVFTWEGTVLSVTTPDGTKSANLQGERGLTGSKILKTEFVGEDSDGSYRYLQTFDDGTTTQFVVPVGSGVSSVNGETGALTGYYKSPTTVKTVLGNDTTIHSSATNCTVVGGGGGAYGTGTVAVGAGAFAWSNDCTAVGAGATAGGVGLSEKFPEATALGDGAIADGLRSTAIGRGARTSITDTQTMQLGYGISVLRADVALTVTSDERDKADIKEVYKSLDFIKKLKPVTFVSNPREEYIREEDKKSDTFRKYGMCNYDKEAHANGTLKGSRRRIGLLAQETQQAMVDIYGTDNYANIVNDNFYDLAKKPSDVENKLTLAYSNLVPFLIGAIKEQQEQIEQLKQQVQSLKN